MINALLFLVRQNTTFIRRLSVLSLEFSNQYTRTQKHTLFRDAVHHRAKHQDVCAAVSTASQAAVTAETCGAKHRQATDTLIITQHVFAIPTHDPSIFTGTITTK